VRRVYFLMNSKDDKKRRVWSKAERAHWMEKHRRFLEDYRSIPKPKLSQTITKLLHVHNEYFTAGAIWTRISGAWACKQAAPILKWMVGMPFDRVSIELLKRGCRWSWSPVTENTSTAGTSPQQGYIFIEGPILKDHKHTAHEKLTDGTLAGVSGDGADRGNSPALSGPNMASLSLQTGAQPRCLQS